MQVTPNLYGNLITNIAAGKPAVYNAVCSTVHSHSRSDYDTVL